MNAVLKACINGLSRIGQKLLNHGRNALALLKPAPGWTGLKRWLLQIATLVGISGVGAFLVVTMGLVPIKASSGHWPITDWFLHYAMTRSVSMQAMGIEAPALDDPGMALKGATHYATGCFPCHGSPALHNPRIALQMTPNPPYLPPVIHKWEPQELFYIVKHGVKFTGMPAWPAQQRDDEVWAIVAFLVKFPEFSEQEYLRMVSGEDMESHRPDTDKVPLQALSGRKGVAQSVIDSCGRCHGKDGQGREAGVAPKLAGQQAEYLEASLQAYSRGERHSGIMEPIAAALRHEEIREVAFYFSKREATKTTLSAPKPELAISRGSSLAHDGVPKARIPICAECHGPRNNPRNSSYPKLTGQDANYLVQQLELFAKDNRGGSEFKQLMHPIADRLTPEQMRDVALYYQSLSDTETR